MAHITITIIGITNEQVDQAKAKIKAFLSKENWGKDDDSLEVETEDANYDDDGEE